MYHAITQQATDSLTTRHCLLITQAVDLPALRERTNELSSVSSYQHRVLSSHFTLVFWQCCNRVVLCAFHATVSAICAHSLSRAMRMSQRWQRSVSNIILVMFISSIDNRLPRSVFISRNQNNNHLNIKQRLPLFDIKLSWEQKKKGKLEQTSAELAVNEDCFESSAWWIWIATWFEK